MPAIHSNAANSIVYNCFLLYFQKLIQAATNRIDRTKQKMEETSTNNLFPFEEKEKIPQPPSNLTISDWVNETKQRRSAILERRNMRRQRKQDLAKRRTVAAQERMRIISQLARKDKDDDDFGMRDEDWDVYKTISKDGDSDSETENEKLIEFEEILRHHDPTFEEPHTVQEGAAESYQVSDLNNNLCVRISIYLRKLFLSLVSDVQAVNFYSAGISLRPTGNFVRSTSPYNSFSRCIFSIISISLNLIFFGGIKAAATILLSAFRKLNVVHA